ncbi:MAG: hypothetical protein M1133_03785 [Armatimonadetes bacterium]|nr:hypothetical protein [Armatimonadota bacterium]
MVDLVEVAARLETEEKLKITYRFPVRSASGDVTYETRQGDLLDVAEEAGLLYVSHRGDVIWVKIEEVVEITPD